MLLSTKIVYYYMPVHSGAATKQLGFVQQAERKNWVAQNGLYNAMIADTSLDTNAQLAAFKLMADNSRYHYLRSIAQEIAAGNCVCANGMISYPIESMASTDSDGVTGAVLADGTAADAIVGNYKDYYGLLTKYMRDTLNSADSAEVVFLANLCPQIDGDIVLAARALYSLIYNDMRMFSDISCDTVAGMGMRKASKPREIQTVNTKTSQRNCRY